MLFNKVGALLFLVLLASVGSLFSQGESPVSESSTEKKTISLGIAPYASISSIHGRKGLSLFLEASLLEHLHLLVAGGHDDIIINPFLVMMDAVVFTERDWKLATFRFYQNRSEGWLFGAGVAEGSIVQVWDWDQVVAEADFRAHLVELGWAGRKPFYFTFALRLAKTHISNEKIYLQDSFFFDREEFEEAKVFSHIVFEFGGYIF